MKKRSMLSMSMSLVGAVLISGLGATPADAASILGPEEAYSQVLEGAGLDAADSWEAPTHPIAPSATAKRQADPVDWDARIGTRPLPNAAAAGMNQRLAPGTGVAAPGLGTLPYFTFEEFPLWTDVTARVNVANGNLVVGANDSRTNSVGVGSRVDRFYNGLGSRAGAFGGGWLLGTAVDVGINTTPNAVEFTGPSGFTATFTGSDASGWVAPPGLNATLKKVGTQYQITYNHSGETLTFDDGFYAGVVVSDKDRNGVGLEFGYTYNHVSKFKDGAGRYHSFEYDAADAGEYINSIRDAGNRFTRYTRDSADRLISVLAPDGSDTEYTYDSIGRLATITGPSGAGKTTFSYDSSHRVTKVAQLVTTPSGTQSTRSTSFTYNAGSTAVLNANAKTSTYYFDSNGLVISTKDQLNQRRSSEWTSNYAVAKTTDALGSSSTPGNSTTQAYDALNNRTQVQLPTGAASSAQYAIGAGCTGTASGTPFQAQCVKDASGATSRLKYDSAGNLLSSTDTTPGGSGAVTQAYTYATSASTCGGLVGQVCASTDANGKITRYKYSAFGDLILVDAPAPLGDTSYSYDSMSRVKTVTDGRGKLITYTYDVSDHIIRAEIIDGSVTRRTNTTWSAAGYATSTIDVSWTGATPVYVARPTFTSYDTLGRTVTIDYRDQVQITSATASTASAPSLWKTSFTYDAVGNITSNTQPGGVTNYSYDATNSLKTLREPGGTCPTSGAPAANSRCTVFTYNANGEEVSRTFPGGVVQTTLRDNSARVTRMTATGSSGSILSDIGYSFQQPGTSGAAGDRTTIQQRIAYKEQGISANAVTTYAYDSLNRVTKAAEVAGGAEVASWQYGYDKMSNRTSQIRAGATGAIAGTFSYAYNDANQLVSATGSTGAWSYDASGNQTRNGLTGDTSGFNGWGQQLMAGDSTPAYRGTDNNNLVSSNSGNAVYATSLGVAEVTGNGARTYVRTPNGEIIGAKNSAGTGYFIKDALGSVVGITSSAGSWVGGYSYSPYGETRFTTNNALTSGNQIRYIGMERVDSSGIYKFGARYYDPSLGRFAQMDPSGQETNPYTYANGNPISEKDPSGLASIDIAFDIISALMDGQDLYDAIAGMTSGAALGLLYGAVIETACGLAVAAAATVTAGIGLLGAVTCAALAQTVSVAVEATYTY